MTWLRTDDGFTSHPKFDGWNVSQKWAFLELMHYCARYKTEGKVPADLALLPRSTTSKLLALAEQSGWIDRDEQNRMVIHDWAIYNPKDATAASRSKAYRDRNATRDDARNESVTSRAGRRGRPVPSPSSSSLSLEGPKEREREFDQEQTRRAAWQARAQQPDVRSPEAFVTAGMNAGGWPDLYRGAGSNRPTENGSGAGVAYVRALIQNGVVSDALELNAELDAQHVPDDQRAELHDLLPSTSRLPFSALDQDDDEIPF